MVTEVEETKLGLVIKQYRRTEYSENDLPTKMSLIVSFLLPKSCPERHLPVLIVGIVKKEILKDWVKVL